MTGRGFSKGHPLKCIPDDLVLEIQGPFIRRL